MGKRNKRIAKKNSAKKKTLNDGPVSRESKKKFAPGDDSDQDIKRRIGHFAGAGEPHMSLKGTVGKNRKATD